MLTFYFAPGSSSMAPHIGLHEAGAPFEPRPMSFKNGDLRRPEYLAINPEGKVPTLMIDGRDIDIPPLGLGDDFLSHHQDIAHFRDQPISGERPDDDRAEIVPRLDHLDAGERDEG